jgi:histidine triad (HIT) family protein
MDCLFCKIADHSISSKIRYEDEMFIAFDDINPQAETHILIIPKQHITSVIELAEKDKPMISNLVFTAKKIASDLELDKTGYRLVFNSGPDAGQVVGHIHLHLLGDSKLGPIA